MVNDDTTSGSDRSELDTPTERATVARLSIEEFDATLNAIRERRLVAVHKLEALAKVKADGIALANFLKFETALKKAKREIAKLDEAIDKCEQMVNKLRVLMIDIGA